MQENPEEKGDSINLLLKSKLQEAITKQEKLEHENKQLKERLSEYESGGSKKPHQSGNIKGSSSKQESPTKNVQINENNGNNGELHNLNYIYLFILII